MLIGKELESYLAWTIHGRRSPRRAVASTRKGPPRDEDYKAWIRTLPCVACGMEGRSEAAHTGNDGGMSMKASDYSCVPLCADCHTQTSGAYHQVGKHAFELAHGLSFVELTRQLEREWRGKCA